MQIIGIIKWAKKLDKKTGEVLKTCLSQKEKVVYFSILALATILFGFILNTLGGKTPFIDSTTTTFSILAQILTVKRCIEQWYLWLIVNILTLFMWVIAYFNGSNCFATIIMWATYVFLAVYFLKKWQKEIK